MEQKNDAQAIIDAAERWHAPKDVPIMRGNALTCSAVALPKGMELRSIKPLLDEYLTKPERKKGTATLTTVDAFIAYVLRHKAEESVCYLDDRNQDAIVLRAVFNPHGGGAADPDWGDFGASYAFPISDEWQAWTSAPDAMPQSAFAVFLEDRIQDVLDPSVAGEKTKKVAQDLGITLAGPSRLMELSRGLAVHVDGRVSQAVNMSTGEGHLTFSEEHKDATGAPLKVPGGFAIGIPVFRHGTPYSLPVRLRYRVAQGRVTWTISLQGAERALEHAIAEAAAQVAEKTGLPLFRGGPG